MFFFLLPSKITLSNLPNTSIVGLKSQMSRYNMFLFFYSATLVSMFLFFVQQKTFLTFTQAFETGIYRYVKQGKKKFQLLRFLENNENMFQRLYTQFAQKKSLMLYLAACEVPLHISFNLAAEPFKNQSYLRHLEINSRLYSGLLLPIPYMYFYSFLLDQTYLWKTLLMEIYTVMRH